MRRDFIFSCPYFGGYQVQLEVTPLVDDLPGLVQRCLDDLQRQLTRLRLEALVALSKERTYHIHSHTLDALCQTPGPIYVCPCHSASGNAANPCAQ